MLERKEKGNITAVLQEQDIPEDITSFRIVFLRGLYSGARKSAAINVVVTTKCVA